MALKPTIFLGLLCAAFAANLSPSLVYRSGHQYVYDCDGQLASSLSNGEDYSTIRFRAQVNVDFLDKNNAIVKLERPEMGNLNGFLSEPERLHSFQKFDTAEIKPDHVGKLDLPFEMRYDNGKISQIKFHHEDSTWSENIKRSVVNLLQVQLEDMPEDAQEYSSSVFYKTNETTIEGECETAYHIQKFTERNYDSVDETNPTMNITKTINYEECLRRPELRYNYYRSSEPVNWNSRQHARPKNHIDPVVDSMSQYEISLENNVIKSSKVLSKYSYDLVNKDQVSLVTISVGQIILKNTERRSPPESDFLKKNPQDLMHSTEFDILREKFITQGNEEYLRKNPYLRLENAGDVVKNIMHRLVKSSVDKNGPESMDEDATRQFTSLVAILRLCSKNDIEKIHNDIFLSSEFSEQAQQFVKEILADALAVAGTKNTIDHLVGKIQAQEITPSKAARTLEKLYKLRLTSIEMTKPILELCKSSVAQNNENLKRSCYLAWGAMVNAMCGHDHEHEHDHEKWAISAENKICSQAMKKELIQDAMRVYESSSNSDKILALKTLGNMGIDESINSLETIIADKSQDRLVRLNAIDALRNLRDQVPQKVQRLLTPVFRDRREHPEIRMNAFHQLLQTRPDASLFHMLCADMAHETNVDVKSFVFTAVQQMADNANNNLDKETQQTVKTCLVLLEQMDESIVKQSASKKHQYGYFSEPSNWHEVGSLLNFVSIFSNDSYLPKELMASWDLLMGDRIIPNHMQLGLHLQELEQFVSKMYKNIESKNLDEILTRGKRSLVSQYNPLDMLKNLFRKMELVARRRASDAEPAFLLYRRHNNFDYCFYLIDEASLPETLKKLMLEGRIDVSDLEENNQIIRTNGAMYNFESQLKLPTTVGIPMIVTSRMATIGFVDGKYSLSFNKAEKIRDANVEIQLNPQVATSVIVKMEMFSPLFTSGVKTIHSMQGRLPLDMSLEIKSPNVVPTITWRLPTEETRLFHLQSRPITFIRSWPERSNVFIDAKEKTLLVPELERLHSTNDFDFEAPLTGMRFVVEGHGYRKSWADMDWLLSGENAFVLKISPTPSSAKAVRLGGEYAAVRDSLQNKQRLEKIFDERPELFQQQEQQEIELLQEYIRRSNSKFVEFQRLVLKAEAVNGQDQDSVVMDFKVACADHATACLFEKNVKADFGNQWTWKTIGQFARPELHGVYGSVKSRHVVGKVESNWGLQDKNTVSMSFYGKPSQQRVHQFKSLLNKNIDMSDNYERESTLDEKFDRIPSVLKANEYAMVIEHQVSEKTMQSVVPLYNWMKTCPKANIYIPDQTKVDDLVSRRHSTIMARVSYDNALNLTLTTPEEQLEMIHWDSEPKMSRNPKTIVDVFASSHDDYAKCTYKRQEIETFDGKTIDIPLTTCYTLLAKDCGDESNPNFAVSARKVNKRSADLKLRFITRKRVYELYKDERSGQMVVTADGNILREDQFDRYNVRKIESNTLTIYEVKCQHAEAMVRFDGQKVSVRISDVYLNRQCGICGHMNRDREDDFLKHDNTQAKNAQDFHLSYLDRDASECDPSIVRELENEMNSDSRRRQESNSASNYGDDRPTRDPLKKTLILEKREEVCFSLKPVKVCPKNFEAAETEQGEQVEFVCYQRSSATAQRNVREAREKQVLRLEDETPTFTDMVVVPRSCVQY